MNYRSVADLEPASRNWLGKLPSDIELIVGVPRSGMLVANLLALHLNLPMTDVEGLLQGRMIHAGARFQCNEMPALLATKRRILVVDDSVLDCNQPKMLKDRIGSAGMHHDILYAAPYVAPG